MHSFDALISLLLLYLHLIKYSEYSTVSSVIKFLQLKGIFLLCHQMASIRNQYVEPLSVNISLDSREMAPILFDPNCCINHANTYYIVIEC